MTRFALNLNDAGITLFDGEQIVYREPGFAYLGSDSLTTGDQAYAHARIDPRRIQHNFWTTLNIEPFADDRFAHLSAADLVSKQLDDIWAKFGRQATEVVVAVPGYMSAESLGLFLGIASEHQLPVTGMVDAAVAATRREYRGAVPVHVDLGLHNTTLSRMAQPGLAQLDRTELLEGVGVHALYDCWIKTIADMFVQQSRFDPLHTAETEQMLLDRLAGWVGQASRQSTVSMQLNSGDNEYAAEVEALTLIGAAAPLYQQIASRLRALFRAEDLPAIQVTDRVARLPGLVDLLQARVGGEVFVLESGAAVRGVFARCNSKPTTGQGVSLLRQLPWDQSPIVVERDVLTTDYTGVPTHVLFGHTGYAIDSSPLIIGSQESAEERHVELSAEMPGVSRRHCSLMQKDGQCVLQDHSRYGTFLNGHKIDGSSVVQAGDAVRIGSPGHEFQLITTDERNG